MRCSKYPKYPNGKEQSTKCKGQGQGQKVNGKEQSIKCKGQGQGQNAKCKVQSAMSKMQRAKCNGQTLNCHHAIFAVNEI